MGVTYMNQNCKKQKNDLQSEIKELKNEVQSHKTFLNHKLNEQRGENVPEKNIGELYTELDSLFITLNKEIENNRKVIEKLTNAGKSKNKDDDNFHCPICFETPRTHA